MTLRLWLLLLLILCGVSACGTLRTYPGPARSPENVARIRPAAVEGALVVIEAVNGKRLGPFRDRVEVLPGPQSLLAVVVIESGPRAYTAEQQLDFDAEAGREYRLVADWFLYGPRLRVEDERGEVVSESLTPPRREPSVTLRRPLPIRRAEKR